MLTIKECRCSRCQSVMLPLTCIFGTILAHHVNKLIVSEYSLKTIELMHMEHNAPCWFMYIIVLHSGRSRGIVRWVRTNPPSIRIILLSKPTQNARRSQARALASTAQLCKYLLNEVHQQLAAPFNQTAKRGQRSGQIREVTWEVQPELCRCSNPPVTTSD